LSIHRDAAAMGRRWRKKKAVTADGDHDRELAAIEGAK
jgi:hypothetical protein